MHCSLTDKLESVSLSKDFDVIASSIPGAPSEDGHDVDTTEGVARVEEVGWQNCPQSEGQLDDGEDDLGLQRVHLHSLLGCLHTEHDQDIQTDVPNSLTFSPHKVSQRRHQILVLRQLRPEENLCEGPVAELPGDVEAGGEAVDLSQGEAGVGVVTGYEAPPE